MTFQAPRRLKKFVIHLYDFDDRYYHFSVEFKSSPDAPWKLMHSSIEAEPKGAVSIFPPNQEVSRIRITGIYNSNEQANPANRSMHIKEIEID